MKLPRHYLKGWARSESFRFFIWFILFIIIPLAVILFSCAQENILNNGSNTITIDSISPSQGTIGTQVRLYGKGFSNDPEKNQVTVNGVTADVLNPASLSALLITIPAGAKTGNVNLKIDKQETVGPMFVLMEPPVFKDINPYSGYAGTLVRLYGTGFDQIKSISFNSVKATINIQEDEFIEVIAPESTTGPIFLDYGYGQLQATPDFTYLPLPLIRSVFNNEKGLELAASYINPVQSALRVYYDGTQADILNVSNIIGQSAIVLPELPPADINNPFEIVLVSNEIKSLPFQYTIRPEVDQVTYNVVTTGQTTITYDISIYGKYFGNSKEGNKATVTFVTRLSSEVPGTIQSWSPTKVVTRITVDAFWSIGGQDVYRDYYGSITVNGIESNTVKM